MAIEEGVNFAWDVVVRELVFECDSNIIQDATIGVNDPPAAIANIIEGVRHMFHEFQQVLVNHDRKQG